MKYERRSVIQTAFFAYSECVINRYFRTLSELKQKC